MPSSKKSSFAKQFAELEEITKWFERDDVDLERGLEKFERGMALAKELQQQLRDAEVKIQKLTSASSDDAV